MQVIATSSNSNLRFPIPVASNANTTPHLNVAEFPAPGLAKPLQILTEESSTSNTGTSNVIITAVPMIPKNELTDNPDIFFNVVAQMIPPQSNTAPPVDNTNYGLQTQEYTPESEGDSTESESAEFNADEDALENDAQFNV